MKSPTLEFVHRGITRTLTKHATVQAKVNAGELSPQDALYYPWYLRLKVDAKATRPFKLTSLDKIAAVREAKDFLNNREQHPNEFAAFLAQKDALKTTKLKTLYDDWLAAGCPKDEDTRRAPEAAGTLTETIARCLDWWGNKAVSSITRKTHSEFAAWRRQNISSGTGDRTIDVQLSALSCLCKWAVAVERIKENPFAKRKKFQQDDDITHCHEVMPDNDEQMHAILRYLWTVEFDFKTMPKQFSVLTGALAERAQTATLNARIAGGWLCFSALSGLRTGEPKFIQQIAEATEFPANLKTIPVGQIYPMPDGTRLMRVKRTKRGQNPNVLIRPQLDDFLKCWREWLQSHVPNALYLFPIRQDIVGSHLDRACEALKLPRITPYGFGRAYYVRVRRSHGADDATIAVELGQSSNGDLIRSTYGDPIDPVGGKLHDWLPKDQPPAWTLLNQPTQTNIIAL